MKKIWSYFFIAMFIIVGLWLASLIFLSSKSTPRDIDFSFISRIDKIVIYRHNSACADCKPEKVVTSVETIRKLENLLKSYQKGWTEDPIGKGLPIEFEIILYSKNQNIRGIGLSSDYITYGVVFSKSLTPSQIQDFVKILEI